MNPPVFMIYEAPFSISQKRSDDILLWADAQSAKRSLSFTIHGAVIFRKFSYFPGVILRFYRYNIYSKGRRRIAAGHSGSCERTDYNVVE